MLLSQPSQTNKQKNMSFLPSSKNKRVITINISVIIVATREAWQDTREQLQPSGSDRRQAGREDGCPAFYRTTWEDMRAQDQGLDTEGTHFIPLSDREDKHWLTTSTESVSCLKENKSMISLIGWFNLHLPHYEQSSARCLIDQLSCGDIQVCWSLSSKTSKLNLKLLCLPQKSWRFLSCAVMLR